MKIENLKRAKQIASQIKKLKDQNERLNGDVIIIDISDKIGREIFNGASSKKGLEKYNKQIREFLNNLSVKMGEEIQTLTTELEKL